MNYYTNIFFIVSLFFSIAYTQDLPRDYLNYVNIQNYSFGETPAQVLKNEKDRQEFSLLSGETNTNRLVYQGKILGSKARLIFLFRQNRLISLSYIWKQNDISESFKDTLIELLLEKYGNFSKHMIPTKDGIFEIQSFVYHKTVTNIHPLTRKKTIISNPLMSIDLEYICITNEIPDKEVYILEYRAFDTDYVIKKNTLFKEI